MSSWSQADVDAIHARRSAKRPTNIAPSVPKPSKMHNQRVVFDGHKFDSKHEARYWLQLKLREKAGEITDLQRQIVFPLYAPIMDDLGLFQNGGMVQVSEFRADYVYRDLEKRLHIVDAKGHRTRAFILAKKWLELQQGIVIEEVR